MRTDTAWLMMYITWGLSHNMCNALWGHPHVIPSPIQSCFTSQLPFLCPYTNQRTDLVNSSLTHTANHSLTPPLLCLLLRTKKTAPDKRNYLLEATPISPANQPMAEQADQQWPVQKWPRFQPEDSQGLHPEVHQERTHQDRRYDARLPGHVASWTGHPAAALNTVADPSTSLRTSGKLTAWPRWFNIARGLPEASSRHGNAALHHDLHYSTADDKVK